MRSEVGNACQPSTGTGIGTGICACTQRLSPRRLMKPWEPMMRTAIPDAKLP